ncbi:MAG: bifunctional folylpolyglutamate synthase/dihydrofolate synthase [Bacteroidales bacterium]|nr:bifunctional folylpolyglutamate synthase/dihydrofolate synthase [Bacteroidales bacterium]
MEFTLDAYNSLIEDIFRRFPSVQKDGFTAGAYKPGLERMEAFDRYLGYPSRQFKSIHIAGTNGKGSVANLVASALQSCGLRTGLFTSPHILDFRERIRVNGIIPMEYVFKQLTSWMPWIEENNLSFFEITTGLAFKYFADSGVDYAVIETGLGGRLDSTNILEKPELTIVTTIGFDHMALLGDTLEKIAAEKAGIFKEGVPALIGDALPETRPVFQDKANGFCPLFFAQEMNPTFWGRNEEILSQMDLGAEVQCQNLRTVLSALDILGIQDERALDGIIHTAHNMEFHGRWERLQNEPLIIADIGHNAHALRHNFAQLEAMNRPLIVVYGVMADKDLDAIIPLMSRKATYIFTSPATPRALPARDIADRFGGSSIVIDNVQDAVKKALEIADRDTIIYIGGSTFVVSEALPLFK